MTVELTVKCANCGYKAQIEATFCPSCGAPLTVKMSDEEISKLVLRLFGKKEDEALEAARVACLSDISTGILHRDLLLRSPVPDLLPKEQDYQNCALKRFIDKFRDDSQLGEALGHYKLGLIYEKKRKVKEAAKEYDHAI